MKPADRVAALECLPAFLACGQWQEQGGRFVRKAEGWLKERGWEDDVPPDGPRSSSNGRTDINAGPIQPSAEAFREYTPEERTEAEERRRVCEERWAAEDAEREAKALAEAEVDPRRPPHLSAALWTKLTEHRRTQYAMPVPT
jgi:hypothetical protein